MRSWKRYQRVETTDAQRDIVTYSKTSADAEREFAVTVDSTLTASRETSAYGTSAVNNVHDTNTYADTTVSPQRHVFTPSGAEVYVDGVFVGFASGETYPLTLTGVSLSDGDHTVEVRPSKRFWTATRTGSVFNVRVATGTTASTLVTVTDLTCLAFENRCRVTWNVVDDGVTYTHFKLVVKAGSAPTYTAVATDIVSKTTGLKSYTWWTTLPAVTSYVGVFPFNNTTFKGTADVTALMPVAAAPNSPADQWMHDDRTGKFEYNTLP